jgi:hypothetical protein
MNIPETKLAILSELDKLQALREKIEDKTCVFDYGDLGNSIGYALQALTEEEVIDFVRGIKHGLSLNNGTHWKK